MSGWQYLFADVDLSGPELGHARHNMEHMLDVLPDLFPEHDYAPFQDRCLSPPGRIQVRWGLSRLARSRTTFPCVHASTYLARVRHCSLVRCAASHT